jgi:hypothetical protein
VTPVFTATPRTLQCVVCFGRVRSTVRSSRATSSSSCVRGRPGRGAWYKPARRWSRKRRRQLSTRARLIPTVAAMARWLSPASERRMISARRVTPAGIVVERRTRLSCTHSRRDGARVKVARRPRGIGICGSEGLHNCVLVINGTQYEVQLVRMPSGGATRGDGT